MGTTQRELLKEFSFYIFLKPPPKKLKGKFYRTTISPVMLYGSKCEATKKEHKKTSATEMRITKVDVW